MNRRMQIRLLSIAASALLLTWPAALVDARFCCCTAMTSQFATMELDADIASTSTTMGVVAALWGRLPSSLTVERPCEAVTSAGSWSYALVGQCFSRMRRAQFDEEHQRSLLSCHSTDESDRSDGYNFPEDAMLELRRRIMKDESLSRKPTFAKDLDYEYQVQYPLPPSRKPTSRWEKRKANALALKLQAEQASKISRAASHSHSAPPQPSDATAFTTLLSETERALDDILLTNDGSAGGSQSHSLRQQGHEPPLAPGTVPRAEDVRRMSVDELLAPRTALLSSSSSLSTCSTASSSGDMSPEKTSSASAVDSDDATQLSSDARALRSWLAEMDPPRASEYHMYARLFEAQGFHALADLAELAEDEVEQAMSEVGIAKFAHRARIRKAILRLCQQQQPPSNNNSNNLLDSTQAA